MGWQGRGIFAMPFSPLAKTVRHDSVRLQRGPSEPALEQLELLKRQDLRNRVYGQINVYGVTTKSERHKRSYWTRTADGNGIGGRKAPVPYGS